MIKVKPQGSKSMATGKNIPNPASTFLETGPKDELAAADAYSGASDQFKTGAGSGVAKTPGITGEGNPEYERAKKVTKRVTSVTTQNAWTALLCGSFDEPPSEADVSKRSEQTALWMRSTGCTAENLIGLISTEGGVIGLNRDEMEDRLSSAMGQSMHTLEPDFQDYMVESMAAMTGQDAAAVKMSMNAAQTSVGTDQQKDASALSKLLSNVTGSDELIQIFDMHAEVAVIGALLDKSIEMGVPQAVEKLLERIDDEKVQRRVALERLRLAALGSQLGTVRTIVDMSGADAAMAKVPDIVPLITQHYDWGYGTSRDEYPDKRDELIKTLSELNSRWYLKKRDGVWVSDLEPFSVASDKALTLFKMSDYQRQAMIAPTYPERSYTSIARQYHPKVPIGYGTIYG